MRHVKVISVLFFILLIPSFLWAWTGDVIGISDGDTITVLKDKTQFKIRLYGIDCPEKGQAFSNKAKQFTSKMVFKKQVEIKPVTKDRYGRTVAWVYVEGKSLCEELLKAGLAWHYKKYSTDQVLSVLEIKARKEKVGLWSDKNAIAPWDYRRSRKKAKTKRQDGDSRNIRKSLNVLGKGDIEAIDLYRLEIAYAINKNWAFDQKLPIGREKAMASIAFKVMPDGQITEIEFVDRSGYQGLDNSAYKAVAGSSPVKPHPAGLNRPFVKMGVRFTPDGVR